MGLEDQLLPGSPESCRDMTVAGSGGQALWVVQMFSCAFPKSPRASPALSSGAGGLPALLTTAAVEPGAR